MAFRRFRPRSPSRLAATPKAARPLSSTGTRANRNAYPYPLRRHQPGASRQATGWRAHPAHFLSRIESITRASIRKAGAFFVFSKSVGGNEFNQNYRYDLATGDVTLLSDGKSRNSCPTWSHDGTRFAYTSTRRNGADTDLYLESPNDPKTDHLLAEVKGGGWEIADWSPDGSQLLVIEEISINESYLWLFDTKTGARTELTPRPPPARKR